MSVPKNNSQEFEAFLSIVKQRHRRINPCFMTGKGCVHTEHIDREWEDRSEKNMSLSGFLVRPFRPNVEAFFELCLERYLNSAYSPPELKLSLEQADRIRRTGYIVCEKICRRVQSVDFLVVDVSAPNANVFYELGLAYGIDHKIIVIFQESSEFGKTVSDYLSNAGCRAYPYKDLNPIRPSDFPLSQYIWHRKGDSLRAGLDPTILLLSKQYGFIANANMSSKQLESATPEKKIPLVEKVLGLSDIQLSYETHIKATIGVAIADIIRSLEEKKSIPAPYIDTVRGLLSPEEVKKEANFNEVQQQVNNAYCTIIHTGGETAEPMAYFWLGYCHSNGKNVIPVTVVDSSDDDIDDLAFDIRALWHMTFIRSAPSLFAKELQETLQQMVISDFSEWSRRSFWDQMLDRRGKISIFTGALHNDPIGRDMIGDWDLRAASELTSFFAGHQYRATIESPIYQIEQVTMKRSQEQDAVQEKDYFDALERMLMGKNCIIIASPDVNPLTEILLGKLYGVDRDKWFTNDNEAKEEIGKKSGAVIAFKEAESKSDGNELEKGADTKKENKYGRSFFQQIQCMKKKDLKRGFKGHGVPKGLLTGDFISQKDETGIFTVHAHLVIAKNPFDPPDSEPHHIVILNGVSGPATFALTHILTGGTSTQFVSYEEGFNPHEAAEAFLQKVVKNDLEMLNQGNVKGIQYLIEVRVGPPGQEQGGSGKHIFDWRRIQYWNRIDTPPVFIYDQK